MARALIARNGGGTSAAMAKAKPYYAAGSLSAAYYDLITDADVRLRGDEDIYAALAPPGGAILELGCGSGRLTAGWLTGGLVRQFQKEVRPLMAVSVHKRLTNFPDVPTGYELKFPNLDIEGFVGFFLLKGTPPPIVDRLSAEIDRITARPDVREQILSYALEVPAVTTRAQFAAVMRASAEEWAKAIRQSGVKVE